MNSNSPSAPRSGFDMAAWALLALVVAGVCAFAGWMYARQESPGRGDLERYSSLAARDGAMEGMQVGYRDGADLGRREARIRARAESIAQQREAYQQGRSSGIENGRSVAALRAGDPYADISGLAPTTGSYTSDGYDEMFGDSALDDEPGFSSSAYGSYGSSSSSPLAESGYPPLSNESDRGFLGIF